MRSPERIDRVLAALETLWRKNPDLRLGQLLSNVLVGRDPFYVEDDDLLDRIAKELKSQSDRTKKQGLHAV